LNKAGQSQPSLLSSFDLYQVPPNSEFSFSSFNVYSGNGDAENISLNPFSGFGKSFTASSMISGIPLTKGSFTSSVASSSKTQGAVVFVREYYA